MKQWILIITIYLPHFLLAQHADIEGDTKITGRLDILTPTKTNVFIGLNAGVSNEGIRNTLLGSHAGNLNQNGSHNSFFGFEVGRNSSGSFNSLFGYEAGYYTEGSRNSMFGAGAGYENREGARNSFFGYEAGYYNVAGQDNSFFGYLAGIRNTSGSLNTFVGYSSGDNNGAGTNNTFIGAQSNKEFGVDSLDRAIAIGYNARVGCHNCAVIGGTDIDAVNVGIGTSSPEERLSIEGERTAFIKMKALDHDSEILFGANFFGAQLKTISNHDIDFFTHDTKRMTLTHSGELGIGIDDADGKLHVVGSSADNTLLRLTDAGHINGGFTLTGTATGIPGLKHFRIMNREDGDLQFGTNAKFKAKLTTESFEPEATNDIDLGTSDRRWKTLFVSNGVNNSSDLRLKTDIQPLKYGLATLQNLNPVSYRWISNTSEEKLGLIAQEVLKVIPEVVNQPSDPDLMMGLDYTELIPVLIKAILELKEEVDSLKNTD